MRKVYLHIGPEKQEARPYSHTFRFNPEFQNPETNEKFLYCCIQNDGKIIFGDKLKRYAEQHPLKYRSTAVEIPNMVNLEVLKNELDRIFDNGYTPIFSCEGWFNMADAFRNANFLNKLDISARVIIYVRPQVEWFNSAWWQWLVWEKAFKKPQDVIDAFGYNYTWCLGISHWKGLDGVEDVKVRLYPTDIIEDFLGVFKQPPVLGISQKYRVNTSLPPILIRLLLKYPFLRSTHGAHVDAMFSKFLKFEGKSPWIISTDLAYQMITAYRSDNEKLLGMLDEASQEIMKNDPRWWDADYYKGRYVFNKKDLELSGDELLSIVTQTLRALIFSNKDLELSRKELLSIAVKAIRSSIKLNK